MTPEERREQIKMNIYNSYYPVTPDAVETQSEAQSTEASQATASEQTAEKTEE